MLKIPENIQQKIHKEFISKIYDDCKETNKKNFEETVFVNDIYYVVEAEIEIDAHEKFQPQDPREQDFDPIDINCYSYRISLLNSDMDDVIDCPLKKKLEIDIKNLIN